MTSRIWLGAVAVAMLMAGQSKAQDDAKEKRQEGRERFQAFMKELKEADKDGDKKISKEEAFGRLKENFDKIDANKDGFIEASELTEAMAAVGRRMMAQSIMAKLKEADKDGDNKLSKDEAPEQLKQHFDKVDTNSDGFVDKEEAEKAIAQLGKMMDAYQTWIAELKAADKDGDKKLSREEAPGVVKDHFDEIDDNSDGYVDAEELKKAIEEYREKKEAEGKADEPKAGEAKAAESSEESK